MLQYKFEIKTLACACKTRYIYNSYVSGHPVENNFAKNRDLIIKSAHVIKVCYYLKNKPHKLSK